MNSRILFSTCLLTSILISCSSDDEGIDFKTDNPKSTAIDKAVDAQLSNYMGKIKAGQVVVGVFRKDAEKFYSYCATSQSLPTTKSIYEIGSISKTFTGLLLANLVEVGTVGLDDPLSDHLDAATFGTLTRNGKEVTIRHLLTHTSGLPENPPSIISGIANGTIDPENPAKDYSLQKLKQDMKSVTLLTEPGEEYLYSNFGYVILGVVLENHLGKAYDEIVKDGPALAMTMPDTVLHFHRNSSGVPLKVTLQERGPKLHHGKWE